MKKFCLLVGSYSSDDTFLVNDLENVNQLYGAMRNAVENGSRLLDVLISD